MTMVDLLNVELCVVISIKLMCSCGVLLCCVVNLLMKVVYLLISLHEWVVKSFSLDIVVKVLPLLRVRV
jgi:hypothetical protein